MTRGDLLNLAERRKGLTEVEHRALKSVAVQFFVNGAVIASYIPRLPEIRDALGLTLTGIGVILAVATSTGILGSALQSPVISAVGTRRAMTVSSSILVAGLAIVGFANSQWLLIAALMVIAISDVVTDVAMNMQGSALSARRSVPVVNRLHGLWSLGTVVGGIVASAAAASGVALRTHLLITCVVLGAALVYVAPGLLATDAMSTDSTDSNDSVGAAKHTAGGTVFATFLLLGAAAIIPEMITSDWAAFRLADDLGTSNGLAGLGFVAFTSGMVVGRFAADSVVSRIGPGRVLRIATVVAALGISTAMLIPAPAVTLAGLTTAGLGISVMFPQLYDAAAKSRRAGRALAGLTAGSRLALLATPLAVGLLAGAGGLAVGTAVAIITLPACASVLALTQRLSGTSTPR